MIELYNAEECPFCVKVRLFLEEQGIAYISKPMPLRKPSPLKEELLKIGGKVQVPFLVDHEKNTHLYESDEIIEYIKKNLIH